MTTKDSLLLMIRERPEDDGPRLVLADFLEETGQCRESQLIRVMLEMANIGSGQASDHKADPSYWSLCECKRCVLQREFNELLPERLRASDYGRIIWRRGFPEEIQVTHQDQIMEVMKYIGPLMVMVRKVTFTKRPTELDGWVREESRERVRRRDMIGGKWGEWLENKPWSDIQIRWDGPECEFEGFPRWPGLVIHLPGLSLGLVDTTSFTSGGYQSYVPRLDTLETRVFENGVLVDIEAAQSTSTGREE